MVHTMLTTKLVSYMLSWIIGPRTCLGSRQFPLLTYLTSNGFQSDTLIMPTLYNSFKSCICTIFCITVLCLFAGVAMDNVAEITVDPTDTIEIVTELPEDDRHRRAKSKHVSMPTFQCLGSVVFVPENCFTLSLLFSNEKNHACFMVCVANSDTSHAQMEPRVFRLPTCLPPVLFLI